MNIKKVLKKIIMGKRGSSGAYVDYLRNIGVKIGDDVIIYVPSKTLIDEQYPWMITIGDHVRITEGVKILTHDYAWSVLKRYPDSKKMMGGIYGASGKVTIGSNVFIGMNSIINRNVVIGDNVIIGAGSIVTKDCLRDGVYAGNPAKYISSMSDYLEKRKASQLNEAKELALAYYERYRERPNENVFQEYFMLFQNNDITNPVFLHKLMLCGNYEESIDYLSYSKPIFNSFKEFMEYCYGKE